MRFGAWPEVAWLPPRTRFESVGPPPTPALILSITPPGETESITVVFDSPVDGSMLPGNFLGDVDTGHTTTAFAVQVNPTTVIFNVPDFTDFAAGHAWLIAHSSPLLVFPQSGIIPVPGIIAITACNNLGDPQMYVTFDSPVDGTTLDADFLTDDTTGHATNGFNYQAAPNQVVFEIVDGADFTTGDLWHLTRPQPLLLFPQTGVC